MTWSAVAAQRHPSRHDEESYPRRYFTWRRGASVVGAIVGGLGWSLGSLVMLVSLLLDSSLPEMMDAVTYIAMLAPPVATVCIVVGVLLPSPSSSHRLVRGGLVPAGLWALSWIVILASL